MRPKIILAIADGLISLGTALKKHSKKPAPGSQRKEPPQPASGYISKPTIQIVGVGGCGNGIVNRMIESGFDAVEYVAINTDARVLAESKAPVALRIGEGLTGGLGAGGDYEIGRKAAEDKREAITAIIGKADNIILTAGLGGGTGTGAAPVIAGIAKELCIKTIAVVTMPFAFEGKQRQSVAEHGADELRKLCDTFIALPNDELLKDNESLVEALKQIDNAVIKIYTDLTEQATA